MKKKLNLILIILMLLNLLLFNSNIAFAATITSVPSISIPSNVNAGENITSSWNSISGATGYLVALLDQTTGIKLINDYSTTQTSYTISSSKLIAGHNYKFWIGVTNAAEYNK